MIAIKHILVPVDFSEPSSNALRYGKEFAAQFKANLHLLHVLEEALIYGGSMPLAPEVIDDLNSKSRQALDQLLTAEEKQQFNAQLVIRHGSPFLDILRYAKEQPIDLIILGSHGRGPVAHMLMGSVAEKVVRKAQCPVLTVHDPEHEFVRP